MQHSVALDISEELPLIYQLEHAISLQLSAYQGASDAVVARDERG